MALPASSVCLSFLSTCVLGSWSLGLAATGKSSLPSLSLLFPFSATTLPLPLSKVLAFPSLSLSPYLFILLISLWYSFLHHVHITIYKVLSVSDGLLCCWVENPFFYFIFLQLSFPSVNYGFCPYGTGWFLKLHILRRHSCRTWNSLGLFGWW